MESVVEIVPEVACKAVAVCLVAPGLHQPVDDIEPEARVAETRLSVEKRPACNTGNIALLAHNSFDGGSLDADLVHSFRHLESRKEKQKCQAH